VGFPFDCCTQFESDCSHASKQFNDLGAAAFTVPGIAAIRSSAIREQILNRVVAAGMLLPKTDFKDTFPLSICFSFRFRVEPAVCRSRLLYGPETIATGQWRKNFFVLDPWSLYARSIHYCTSCACMTVPETGMRPIFVLRFSARLKHFVSRRPLFDLLFFCERSLCAGCTEQMRMNKRELELWKRYRLGDDAAREQLILSYIKIVRFWVAQISKMTSWANPDDLLQEGIRGLMEAVDGFDPMAGYEFKTYARKFIRGAIFRNPELSRDLCRHQRERLRKVRTIHDSLMKKLGRAPTTDEIAEASGFTSKQIMNALDAVAISFANELPDPEEQVTPRMASAARQYETVLVQEAISRLSDREAHILTGHYWVGKSDVEIAKELVLTQAAVSKLRQRAIIKLRAILEPSVGYARDETWRCEKRTVGCEVRPFDGGRA